MLQQWPTCAALLCVCIMSTRALHCTWGQFSSPPMESCHPWLQCDAIAELPIGGLLGFGAVKQLYESEWKGSPVVLAFLNNPDYHQDFHTGLNNLKVLAVYPGKVVQLIGFCESSNVYVTELQPFRDATNVNSFLETFHFYGIVTEMRTRLLFCIKYVEILVTLHAFPLGAMVMCDSNSLEKTLQQYLISEKHLLLLGDTDALPVVLKTHGNREAAWNKGADPAFQPYCLGCQCVGEEVCCNPTSYNRVFHSYFMCFSNSSRCFCKANRSSDGEATGEYSAVLKAMPRGEGGIRCGTKHLTGEFVAPEQRGEKASLHRVDNVLDGKTRSVVKLAQAKFSGSPDFDKKSMPNAYNEATDVFKIPPVCEYFLGEGKEANIIKRKLSGIHNKCKSYHPDNRASAVQVLEAYSKLYARLSAVLQGD